MARQWYADYKDGRSCLQHFSFRTLNAKHLWASCHSAFACKSSMRTLRQFSCAKSASSTLCLATCRSTSPSIKTRRSVTCSDRLDVQKTWSVLHPLSNQVGPSRLCSTRRTVLKAPAPRKLIDFKSDNVTSVQPMTICCVWCEIGKPNNEKQWKTAFTKDTLKLLNSLTIYYIHLANQIETAEFFSSRILIGHCWRAGVNGSLLYFSFVSFLNLFHPMCS